MMFLSTRRATWSLMGPSRPLSDKELGHKFRDNANYSALKSDKVDEAIKTIRELDKVDDAAKLMKSLSVP